LLPPDISAGLRPRPHWGAYGAAQTTYLDLRGPTSKEREGKERWREGEKRGREERMCAVGIFNYFRLCNSLHHTTIRSILQLIPLV